jgi:tetratricopeptide (TPR) repeat protein
LPAQDVAARKALALDDAFPESHLAMAGTYWLYNWDFPRADQEVLRAIELDPKFAEAHHLRAMILGELNRQQEALEEQKKATELDPFSRPFAMALAYKMARQYDGAIADARQRLESLPNDWTLYWILSETYRCKGMEKEAVQTLERMLQLQGDKTSAQGVRHAREHGGYNAVLHWQIADMERKSAKQYVSPVQLAYLYAQLGEREKTLDLLEEGYRQHSPYLLDIQNDPAYDFLHADPSYRSLVQKIGLPPVW